MSTPTESESTAARTDHLSDRKFVDFPISRELLQGILEHGYDTATPIQAATIEPALAGKDLLARAKTGTGKTAAFSIPIVERVDPAKKHVQALLLAPTRELAQQIAEEIDALAIHKDITTAVLVGGLSMGPQETALNNGAAIVVGTPGRVLDHHRRKNLDLSNCHMACLDEADEMVSMGFYEDVTKILSKTQEDRQVLLFSATISPDTARLVRQFLKDPEEIILSTDEDRVEGIEHIAYEAPEGMPKARALMYMIDAEDPDAAIIFCNTRQDTNSVAAFLDRQGLDVQLLSGELPQGQRSEVMRRVKAGEVRFLVATDVASRGIDISDLTHVFNYSLPKDAKVYLHRIGRTGRIGNKGRAISLLSGTDMGTRKTLENVHRIEFDERVFPDEIEAVRKRVDRQAKVIRSMMGKLVFESYLPTVRALKERPDGDLLLAVALRGFFAWDRQRKAAAAEAETPATSGQTARSNDRDDSRDRKSNDRGDRKGRGRDGDRKGRGRDDDRKGRGRDDDRSEKRPKKSKVAADDLDALLEMDADDVLESAPVEAKKPKRKRTRKPKKAASDADESSPSAASGGDSGDDLDALLSMD
ncbi:MAG: DEAD/DEAH box helicase [Myxococcota bacterium]